MGVWKTSPATSQSEVIRLASSLVIYIVPFHETHQRFSAEGGAKAHYDTKGLNDNRGSEDGRSFRPGWLGLSLASIS
jgi:hypothetical protein